MIKYLKYIILIFGSIGLLAAGFFGYQNRVDLSTAYKYRSIIDYEYLQKHCSQASHSYYYPCLKEKYIEYLKLVSFTGTNIGLRMMFSVMEEDKNRTTNFASEELKAMTYTVNYLEVNNLTMDNAYKNYFGLQSLYGGYIATLREYYTKANIFSEDLIRGLESNKGLQILPDSEQKRALKDRFLEVRKKYYQIKENALDFVNKETLRLTNIKS